MSATNLTIRYDGPMLAEHRMDISDIAPALLGISELCKIANRNFNDGKANVQVFIAADAEHKCFQLKLHVVQTLWEHTKTLLASDNVKSALELAKILGLVSGGSLGLFQLLKKVSGKKVTKAEYEQRDGGDVIRVTVEGDNNTVLIVRPESFHMLFDESAVEQAKKVVQPVTRSGIESLEFETDQKIEETFTKDEAVAITKTVPGEIVPVNRDVPQEIKAWVSVYSPVYDAKAPKWRFKFGEAHEYMDISETDIAADAIRRGGAMVDDAYYVVLEITQEHKATGGISNAYKIKEVLDFRPARLPYQTDAFKDRR